MIGLVLACVVLVGVCIGQQLVLHIVRERHAIEIEEKTAAIEDQSARHRATMKDVAAVQKKADEITAAHLNEAAARVAELEAELDGYAPDEPWFEGPSKSQDLIAAEEKIVHLGRELRSCEERISLIRSSSEDLLDAVRDGYEARISELKEAHVHHIEALRSAPGDEAHLPPSPRLQNPRPKPPVAETFTDHALADDFVLPETYSEPPSLPTPPLPHAGGSPFALDPGETLAALGARVKAMTPEE